MIVICGGMYCLIYILARPFIEWLNIGQKSITEKKILAFITYMPLIISYHISKYIVRKLK